jgi:hypothetical protein
MWREMNSMHLLLKNIKHMSTFLGLKCSTEVAENSLRHVGLWHMEKIRHIQGFIKNTSREEAFLET